MMNLVFPAQGLTYAKFSSSYEKIISEICIFLILKIS